MEAIQESTAKTDQTVSDRDAQANQYSYGTPCVDFALTRLMFFFFFFFLSLLD